MRHLCYRGCSGSQHCVICPILSDSIWCVGYMPPHMCRLTVPGYKVYSKLPPLHVASPLGMASLYLGNLGSSCPCTDCSLLPQLPRWLLCPGLPFPFQSFSKAAGGSNPSGKCFQVLLQEQIKTAYKVLLEMAPFIPPCVPTRILLFTLVQFLSPFFVCLFLKCLRMSFCLEALPPTCTM